MLWWILMAESALFLCHWKGKKFHIGLTIFPNTAATSSNMARRLRLQENLSMINCWMDGWTRTWRSIFLSKTCIDIVERIPKQTNNQNKRDVDRKMDIFKFLCIFWWTFALTDFAEGKVYTKKINSDLSDVKKQTKMNRLLLPSQS